MATLNLNSGSTTGISATINGKYLRGPGSISLAVKFGTRLRRVIVPFPDSRTWSTGLPVHFGAGLDPYYQGSGVAQRRNSRADRWITRGRVSSRADELPRESFGRGLRYALNGKKLVSSAGWTPEHTGWLL